MILLGILLLILGFFFWRPLTWIGGLLIVIGIILYVASVPGPFAGYYY